MFAAIFNCDREPVDLRLMAATGTGRPRVPSLHVETFGGSRQVAFLWSAPAVADDACGFASLGDRYRIVGRIRLDGRDDLRSRLSLPPGHEAAPLSDALLCLHAYAAWGERFVDFLAGDFCFALWDDDKARLICGRDQLGVRSLFHAAAGNARLVGDSLDWLSSLSADNSDLDDYWIADFLSIGFSLDPERTIHRHIHRLAPAHLLTISETGTSIRRYWQLDVKEPLHYRDQKLYAERFRELLSLSIADRLPIGRVGVSMSGGLDSTSLAAMALAETGDAARVFAECFCFEKLMPDDEGHFSSIAARHLGIDLRVTAIDHLTYDPQWRDYDFRTAEPSQSVVSARHDRLLTGDMARQAGVWLHGEGPDNALHFDRDPYLSWLFKRREWVRLAGAILQYAKVKGLSGWAATVRRHTGGQHAPLAPIPLPAWLDRGFVDRLHLVERVRNFGDPSEPRHAWHPRSVASFGNPIWQRLFADCDWEEQLAPMVWRHPYLDLRVLEFMLSVPPVPWAWEKRLLREAMRGHLPPEILGRKKTPLAGSPLINPVRQHGLPALSRDHRLSRYVAYEALPTGEHTEERGLWQVLSVHALDHWLSLESASTAGPG
jgi:asparagine synthase (glutamine-hydrolysing)